MTQQYCPSCGEIAVPASGPTSSKVLIIGEQPGEDELSKGRPFVGPAGKVFREELYKVGLDLNELRLMNLWLHLPNKNESCYKAGYDLVLEEAKKKKCILLVGSEAVSAFTEYSVSKVCGLEVPSIFSCKHVWVIQNPAQVFHGGVGELRLGLKKWSDFLKKEKLV